MQFTNWANCIQNVSLCLWYTLFEAHIVLHYTLLPKASFRWLQCIAENHDWLSYHTAILFNSAQFEKERKQDRQLRQTAGWTTDVR